jgi:hypothetical protein
MLSGQRSWGRAGQPVMRVPAMARGSELRLTVLTGSGFRGRAWRSREVALGRLFESIGGRFPGADDAVGVSSRVVW